jgi:CRISPR-associated protein Cmr1
MKKLEYTVEFVTPAFLGNADQSSQWRTPPFKTMLRQWWRVLNSNLSVDELRKNEAKIFGAALDETGNQSRVRVRLGQWSDGKMNRWPTDPTWRHPEVGTDGMLIGSHLYLGLGPLENFQRSTRIKKNAAIQYGESNTLSLIVNEELVRRPN